MGFKIIIVRDAQIVRLYRERRVRVKGSEFRVLSLVFRVQGFDSSPDCPIFPQSLSFQSFSFNPLNLYLFQSSVSRLLSSVFCLLSSVPIAIGIRLPSSVFGLPSIFFHQSLQSFFQSPSLPSTANSSKPYFLTKSHSIKRPGPAGQRAKTLRSVCCIPVLQFSFFPFRLSPDRCCAVFPCR